MKLKHVLILAFVALTCIPSIIVSLLLYKSGFELSKESYTRNLVESIGVQADYISQTVESNMVIDYRFANRSRGLDDETLLTAFQSYLETAEDKIRACILLSRDGTARYTIGETAVLERIYAQLPDPKGLERQAMVEFDLGEDGYALGIVTPIDSDLGYEGCLISVFEKSFLFKIVSSYYEISDTSTYLCRNDGGIISARGHTDEEQRMYIQPALRGRTMGEDGEIDLRVDGAAVTGYYKRVFNTPWYLVGLLDYSHVFSFTNRFVWVYLLLVALIVGVDILLGVYFSRRVVRPINRLIQVMDGYPNSLKDANLIKEKDGYVETRYLRTKFFNLMHTISLVQHNFEGIYQLYQSSDMDDTNIDIDVMNQTVHSNKEGFERLMQGLTVPEGACVVEHFTRCFCEKDQAMLMGMLERMRDQHLAVAQEAEVFTPHLSNRWFHVLVVPMYEQERLSRLFIQLRDVSSFKKQEIETLDQASRDPLTQLYNRTGFAEKAARAMSKGGADALHGLLFLDVNDFKLVNDNFGHIRGDQLLRDISDTLCTVVGEEGILVRMGGDEFVVFLPCTDAVRMDRLKTELRERLVYPFGTGETGFSITTSIGEARLNGFTPQALEELLNQADKDMYRVKRAYKQNVGQSGDTNE